MNAVSGVWWEAMTRATWHGAIALGLVWTVSRWVAAIPANYKAWLWRLAFLKVVVAFLWAAPIALPVLPAELPTNPESFAPVATPRATMPIETAVTHSITSATPERVSWRTWLLLVWSAGVLCAWARVLRQWRLAERILAEAQPLDDSIAREVVTRLGRTLRLRRIPSLHESPSVGSPMLIGIFNPRIIIPTDAMERCGAAHLELMLAHELAHIRRRDLAWHWLLTVCEALFFFHPAVWLARREWTITTEAACDELALRATRSAPRDYGMMLLAIVAGISVRSQIPAVSVGMFETANSLKRRLKAMTTKRTWFSTALGIGIVSVATLAIVPCRLIAETPDAAALARLKEENAKLKQELETTRAEMEALRDSARAARQRDEDIQTMQARVHADAARNLQRALRELETLSAKFTANHPDVIAQRREIERLQKLVEEPTPTEPRRYLDPSNKGVGTRMGFVPATAEQIARSREQRDLLAREIELAEKQVEFVRQNLEAGKERAENLLRVQQELLDLKLQQADLSHSKAERMAALAQQLQVAQALLQEQQKRIKVGVLAPGAEIPFEREVLRLQRELGSRQLAR